MKKIITTGFMTFALVYTPNLFSMLLHKTHFINTSNIRHFNTPSNAKNMYVAIIKKNIQGLVEIQEQNTRLITLKSEQNKMVTSLIERLETNLNLCQNGKLTLRDMKKIEYNIHFAEHIIE